MLQWAFYSDVLIAAHASENECVVFNSSTLQTIILTQ